MKPTQITELFANIKKTFVSFFSILMFVALGVGVFLGINWTAPALQNAANGVLDEGSFHHFQIQYPYGLTDDDLTKLAEVEGVTQIEASRQSFQDFVVDSQNRTMKVQTLGREIDVPIVVEGDLPRKTGEIALLAKAAESLGLGVGDTVTFKSDVADGSVSFAQLDGGSTEPDKDGMRYLNGATYKVTGLVNSPEYLSNSSSSYGYSSTPSGSIDIVGWVSAESFDAKAFQDAYPVVNVLCEDLQGKNMFANDYKADSDVIQGRIDELGKTLGKARYDNLTGQIQAKVSEGEKKVADGRRQVAEGEKQLEEGRATYETVKAEGEAKLASAYDQLVSAQAQYDSGLAKYNRLKGEYDEIDSVQRGAVAEVSAISSELKKLNEERAVIGEEEYNRRLEALAARANADLDPIRQEGLDIPQVTAGDLDEETLADIKALLDGARDIPFTIDGQTMTLNEAEAKLVEGRATLDAGYNRIQSGWSEYYAGQATLQQKTAEGEQQLAEGERQLADARKQLADGEQQLAKAKDTLASFAEYDWVLMPRAYNPGTAEVTVFSDVTTNLSFSMAALFIVVGLLVSYSAVSRIVHEQITQIGTKKALGLRSREITMSFLAYSGIAVLAGAIIGTAVGITVVEGIIGHALGGMFAMGDYPPYFGLPLFLIVTALELVLVLGATWLACRSILKEHAVELLRGEKPPAGKEHFYEKWGLWDKLHLFAQTMVNNCVNDKRRVFSTVVGVAGCTALIVTAITLNNDVLKSYDAHYENVYGFTDITYVDASVEGAADNMEKALQGQGSSTAQVLMKRMAMTQPDGKRTTVRIIVPADDDAFARIYNINPVAGPAYDPSAEGVWMSQAYAHHLGAKVGDVLRVEGADGKAHEMPILGFYEFWLTYHEVVMGRDYYEREFGAATTPNVVLSDREGMSITEMQTAVMDTPGFYSMSDDKEYQSGNFKSFASVSSAVVLIYLALSALMAVVVLLNLNVMFINEKKRELIVLMINGFSAKDAKRYIYNDTIVLTVIGIIVGLVVGCAMGSITVGAIEPSTATFIKSIDGMAVLVGVVGSAALAFVMSVIALRRIPRFELTDINKF